MAHTTVQNNPMEIVAHNMMVELCEQGEITSMRWVAKVRQMAGRLVQPRESRFLDARLNEGHDRAMSQISTIHNLTR